MLYLCITIPIIIMVWLLYSSRNMLLWVGGWALRRRYDIEFDGMLGADLGKNYLIIPNHPAVVDPLILVTELHRRKIDVFPFVDESFFSNGILRHVLAMFNAARVPDFRKINFQPPLKSRPEYHLAARRARALGYTALALLMAGENVLVYPSGHISADGSERLGNRQLVYNVMAQLPEGVEVLAVRIRGLYGSMFSRVGGRKTPPIVKTTIKAFLLWPLSIFRRRRPVRIHAELITSHACEWAKLSRAEFDRRLEQWYDADLAMLGLKAEAET